MPSLHGLYVADGQPVPRATLCSFRSRSGAEVLLEGLRLQPRVLYNLQARSTHNYCEGVLPRRFGAGEGEQAAA